MIDMKLRAPAEVPKPAAGRGLIYLNSIGRVSVKTDGAAQDDPVCRRFDAQMPGGALMSVSVDHGFGSGKLISFNAIVQNNNNNNITAPNDPVAANNFVVRATASAVIVTTGSGAGSGILGKPVVITAWGYL